MKLKILEARKLQLQAQGLHAPAAFGLGKTAAVKAIKRLGYVQIDTISVVERAHHHVFWSRVPDYNSTWLHELQSVDKKIFEYWSHAAAYVPMEDYRYCVPRMIRMQNGEKHWYEKDKRQMKKVFELIKINGPMLARDFESPNGRKAGPWFDRSPAKKALEHLFQEGRLVISERRGFQKVYELPERYLPKGLDTSVPSEDEYLRHLIHSTLKANGFATAAEIAYLRKGLKTKVASTLDQMKKEKLIQEIEIETIKETFYAPTQLEVPKFKASEDAFILSPFDNLVIQRSRLKRIFNFDYQIECYVPEPKRKFGYFVLPVLLNDSFVARLDAKADRLAKTLIIKSIHLEPEIKLDRIAKPAAKALASFAKFNNCSEIKFEKLSASERKLLEKSF